MPVDRVFVSYSHRDRLYLDRMMVHLRPLIRDGLVVWSDRDINPGDKWQEKIGDALAEADAAILLISADFLASDFISNNELPPLLQKAEQGGTQILPVVLKPCGYLQSPLGGFQAHNLLDQPVARLSEADQEEVWDALATHIRAASGKTIRSAMNTRPTGGKMGKRDDENIRRGTSITDEDIWDAFRTELYDPNVLERHYVYTMKYHRIGIALDASAILSKHPWGGNLLERMNDFLSRAGCNEHGELRLVWVPSALAEVVPGDYQRKFHGVWLWCTESKDRRTWFVSSVPLRGNWDETVTDIPGYIPF